MRPQSIQRQAAAGRCGRRWAAFGRWHCLEGWFKAGAIRGREGITFCGRAARLWVVGFVLLAGPHTTKAEEGVASPSQLKAAFLVSFPKYVAWPSTTLAATNSPISVAVFGDDNVIAEFREMIQGGKTVNGHPLVLKRITSEDQISDDSQILFIGASEKQRIAPILEKIKGAGILTVGESDDFLDQGGIINLSRKGNNIRLEVNLTAAAQANLKISSRLLSVAGLVKGKSN